MFNLRPNLRFLLSSLLLVVPVHAAAIGVSGGAQGGEKDAAGGKRSLERYEDRLEM